MDRRSGVDRRGQFERRKVNLAGPVERRTGVDRRAGISRRDEARRFPGDRRELPTEGLPS